jgi:hypothetical protein
MPVDTIKTLQSELAAVGLPVRGAEAGGTPSFGSDTQARVRDFQKLYHLQVTGDVDPLTGGVMFLASLVATQTDRALLRAALRNAENAVSGSPQYNDRVARAALLAGDYELAARVSPHLVDLSGVKVNLGGLVLTVGPGSPQQPDVPFPENFYSYRNSLMSEEDINALRAQVSVGATPFLARAKVPDGDPTTPPVQPPPPGVPDPPPATGSNRKQQLISSALAFLNAIEAWQIGNAAFARQRYEGAVEAYNSCQRAVLDYVSVFPDYNMPFTTGTLAARVDELVWHLASDKQRWSNVWSQIGWRRQLLSLAELGQFDWSPITPSSTAYLLLKGNLQGSDQPADWPSGSGPLDPAFRNDVLDTRLVIIAAVLVPLARGEANRLRRQYTLARQEFARVLRNAVPVPNAISLFAPAPLRCDFIETPFARLLGIETMLDQAEAQYKARTSVDDEPDEATKTQELGRITQIAQDLTTRQIPGDPRPGAFPLQHLVAAVTYAGAMDSMQDDGEYVARTKQALTTLQTNITSVLRTGDVTSIAFRSLGQAVTIPTVTAIGNTLPGLTSGTHPHEPYLQFNLPDGQKAMRECNPRVYALLLQAQARLLQIWSGFNYIGYRDDYTPPWRFQFVLDRARYFSEHAKNAQRDYLNFLNNAENEELKEMSAAQNVELEKTNVQIETARVEQATKEVTASQESKNLADMNANDAQQRVTNYRQFSQYADDLFDSHRSDLVGDLSTVLDNVPGLNAALSGVGDLFTGGFVSNRKNALLAHAQRGVELKNLELAAKESQQSAKVAEAQLAVTKAGLVVTGLQRQAALLRHEFALQNLQFMRNQTLNTEQWYRLAGAIRSVSDTYLRYAIELAFLAQQAYNFEADKRLNVIRFDYDLSDEGRMLAADFLLRDLDSLEQDLVVSQQIRQQQVRYVLSMAREFPETLRALTETNEALFNMRLEQLERRFPGLVNLRISSVDLQPVALMDAARFSVELTQLGTGMVRLKAQPGTSPLNKTDLVADGDWLSNVGTDWPVKIRTSGPETAVFSGLSRQEVSSLSTITANERVAFEGLPGASAWRIDMSMKDNRVVPNSLADVLITFTLSGYYDPTLREVVDHAPRKPQATTTWFSAHDCFPDAYYHFNQAGQMDWQITSDILALQGSLGELQNLGVLCFPSQKRPDLGRVMCSYPIEFQVDAAGNLQILRALPLLSFSTNRLVLNATLNTPVGSTVMFDFGDGTGLLSSSALPHTYARPGRYDVRVRIAANGRLTEYRAAVVVSRQQIVLPPCIAIPVLQPTVVGGKARIQPALQGPSGESLAVIWRIDGEAPDSGGDPVTFTLDPGRYVLRFYAIRPLKARFYGQQRYDPVTPLALDGLHLATNRTFDVTTGNETTASVNTFGQHVFGGATLSPIDRWTLQLPLDDNPGLVSVSSIDIKQYDLGELADVFLTLEYKVKDE